MATKATTCPICKEFNTIPTHIHRFGATIIEAPEVKYTDENNHRHIHDMNVRVIEYRCSNNHSWSAGESLNKCWCVSNKSPLSMSSYSARNEQTTQNRLRANSFAGNPTK